jgi:hypothetical protein
VARHPHPIVKTLACIDRSLIFFSLLRRVSRRLSTDCHLEPIQIFLHLMKCIVANLAVVTHNHLKRAAEQTDATTGNERLRRMWR